MLNKTGADNVSASVFIILRGDYIMRKYEDITKISDNLQKQRSYYIPKSGHTNLNGVWNFKFFECDFEESYIEKEWETIDVPSCWQA